MTAHGRCLCGMADASRCVCAMDGLACREDAPPSTGPGHNANAEYDTFQRANDRRNERRRQRHAARGLARRAEKGAGSE